MQPLVTDRSYEFVPPYHGNFWPSVLKLFLTGHLRKKCGVTDVQFRGADRL